jgi:hypothetical protein
MCMPRRLTTSRTVSPPSFTSLEEEDVSHNVVAEGLLLLGVAPGKFIPAAPWHSLRRPRLATPQHRQAAQGQQPDLRQLWRQREGVVLALLWRR